LTQGATRIATTLFACGLSLAQCGGIPESAAGSASGMGSAPIATPAAVEGGTPAGKPTGSIRPLGASHLDAGPEGGALHVDKAVGNSPWRAKARA
jgi:hypothetical protein